MRYEPEHDAFDFCYLERYGATHEQVKKFSDAHYQQFLSLCKNNSKQLYMTAKQNAEWILRTYNATKMIMAATLLLNSAEYCIDKNMMVTVPYLLYYAAFSSARGLLYVSPFNQTKDLDELVEMTHSKVLNMVPDEIKNHFDKDLGQQIGSFMRFLRSQRELFSYKFPADGIRGDVKYDETIEICGLLAELTELASWQIQKVYEKKFLDTVQKRADANRTWMKLDQDVINKIFSYRRTEETGEIIQWVDSEDWYRIDYIRRKVKYPTSVLGTMTEGMTEDFFGAWCNQDENGDNNNFNPDKNWTLIFPIP